MFFLALKKVLNDMFIQLEHFSTAFQKHKFNPKL